MKKQYLAWGLAISLSIGTIFGNSGVSWAFENTNQDKTANVEKEESSLWDELGLLTPSNATELMTSSNAATENTTNKPTETTGLKKQFTTEDGIIVEIDSQDVILPENTQIQVKKVDLGSEITDSVRSSMQENQKELEQIYAYDISFWNDGEEFEPSDGVKVTFKLPDTMTGEQVDESEIFHVKDGEDVAEFVPKTVEGDQEISCQSVGFSVYGIAVVQAEEWISIYTAGDLQNIQNNLSANYRLMNDIDLLGVKWTPLGNTPAGSLAESMTFYGNFDGQNHTISNFKIKPNEPRTFGIGLFGVVGTGTIKNLNIDSASIVGTIDSGSSRCGILAGSCNGKIENCHIKNSIIDIETASSVSIGGIVGAAINIQANNCSYQGELNIKSIKSKELFHNVGGLFGDSLYGNITKCLNYGNISVEYTNGASPYEIEVGGISGNAGSNSEETVMEQCANMGNISVGNNYKFESCIGGIAGYHEGGDIIDCYNNGQLEDQGTAGIVGRAGVVTPVYITTKIENSYNLGKADYGIVRCTSYDRRGNVDVKNCYYINTAENAYAKSERNIYLTNVKRCSASEMKQRNTYQNFDFDDTWKMGLDDYPYPVLQFQDYMPSQPDIPDTSDSDEQLGWVKFENGKVGYYISENNQCHLLKSCVRELNYTDGNGVIFTGKWKFDENGYAITGIDKGLYYYDKEDGVYPYGMCVPDKEVDEILKEEYDQFHIRPSTVMSRYSFISTYMDDMNYLSYILSAKIDDGWMRLTGYVFQTLRKQRGYVDIDDINVEYLMEESNNRKILAQMMDLKFPEQENTEAKPTPEAVVHAWDEVIDEVEYAEFIAEKIADASKNEKKYSNSFKKLMKEVKKKEDSGENNKKKILEGVGKQSYETFKVIMEQANGWSDALKDCSEKISYLNALEESINKIDSRKVQNIQKLKNAVSELKSNYKKQIKFQVLETSFALIEQANLWDEVVTGEKNPLADWTFTEDPKENPKYNVAKIATDVIKKSVEGGLPLLKTFSQAITTIQTIDGRPEAVNTIAQSQMLYTVAYDVLREKEDKFLIDGNSENLADYLNAFEFMRCITLLRYQNMKAVYASIYNRDNLKQVKVDFLQKEINKLQRISPLNYYENEFSPLTFAGSWDESGEKYYYGTNGDERFYIENRWAYIDGKRYYFDQNGRVLVGAQKIMDETGEGEYYFSTGDGSEYNKDHRGAMQTGPIEINGKEYYYDSNSGVNRGRKVINSRIEIGPKDYRYYGPDGAYDREKSGFSEVTDTDPNHKFYDKGGIRYATNCPVDIIIYDENDNMVGKIVNDQVQNVTDDEIDVYVDSAGQKIVGVPQNGKYKLEIIARAAGAMDYSVAEFASDGSGLIGKTDYRAVTLNQADHFYGITESMFYDGEEHNSYRLLKENTEIELAEYQDTLTSYLINASAEGHGTVEGSKAAIRGDFAKLTAKPDSGYCFAGWYDKDGNCVSKELEFRFRVLEEQNFTAKFTVRGASDSGSDSSDDSDDTSYIPKRGVTGKWIKNEKGWWYQRIDGTWPHDEWCELEYLGRKEWYYFDKNGYVVSGWLKWNGCYFYLNPISDGWFGRMETGWKKIDGKWYYLEPVSGQNKGHLFVNTVTPDGYKVDSNGAWMK